MRKISTLLFAAFLAARADAATVTVVSANGDSLQDAIDAASPGDTILADGIFAEAIVIDKSLNLRGAHGIGSVLPGCGGAAGIDVAADGVRIEKIAVFGGPTANIRIAGRNDVMLRAIQLQADTFSGGCPVLSARGVDIDGSTDVLLKAVETHASGTSGAYGEAFIRIANIPADGGVKVSRAFTNVENPVGILVEDSDDTVGVPWRGRIGVNLRTNLVVSSDTGILLRDSTGVVVTANLVGNSVAPDTIGIHVDADSTGNLIRRNRLGTNADDLLVEGAGNCVEKNKSDGAPIPDSCS